MPTIDQIASVTHEANRAYCKTIGDNTQPAWEDAPEWQKESARAGVQFLLDTPHAAGADSHASWLHQKEADGWKFGPVKDPAKKEHPCMVPYHELPHEQRTKDGLFVAIVRAMTRKPVFGIDEAAPGTRDQSVTSVRPI